MRAFLSAFCDCWSIRASNAGLLSGPALRPPPVAQLRSSPALVLLPRQQHLRGIPPRAEEHRVLDLLAIQRLQQCLADADVLRRTALRLHPEGTRHPELALHNVETRNVLHPTIKVLLAGRGEGGK